MNLLQSLQRDLTFQEGEDAGATEKLLFLGLRVQCRSTAEAQPIATVRTIARPPESVLRVLGLRVAIRLRLEKASKKSAAAVKSAEPRRFGSQVGFMGRDELNQKTKACPRASLPGPRDVASSYEVWRKPLESIFESGRNGKASVARAAAHGTPLLFGIDSAQ